MGNGAVATAGRAARAEPGAMPRRRVRTDSRPSVSGVARLELFGRFREGHVEAVLAAAHAFEEELEGEGRLAYARVAFDQVEAVGGESSAEHVVETCDAGRETRGGLMLRALHGNSGS